MTVTVSPSQAKDLVIHCFRRKIVPMLHGSPSTAKSSIVRQIAEEANLLMIDIRLSQFDPVFLLGLPDIKSLYATLIPFDIFPLEGMALPEGKNGWVIFFDEFNSCNNSVQAASYKIILDRMVGQAQLHSKAKVVLAGNLLTDNAIVNEMSTAMQSRASHLQIKMMPKDFIDYAIRSCLETRMISFLEHRPSLVDKFDPDHDDKTYPCSRNWESVSKIIKDDPFERNLLPLIQGTVGEGAGLEFYNYCQLKHHLPSIGDIIANPHDCEIPSQPAHKYMLTSLIVESINGVNAPAIMEYLLRLPTEYCYLVIRMAIKIDPELLAVDVIDEWLTVNAHKYFG